MIEQGDRIIFHGYKARICMSDGYYLDFGGDHRHIVRALETVLDYKFNSKAREDGFVIHSDGIFPEFYDLKDLERFIRLCDPSALESISEETQPLFGRLL